MKLPRKLKIRFRDRHAEHVDESIPLCDHNDHTIFTGDKFVGMLRHGGIVIAEVELVIEANGEVEFTLNHTDYLIERRIKEEVEKRVAEKHED
jgi:flagellar basal body P-ring protein FlgI